MDFYSATITLLLVMDPLGNIPVFLSLLNSVDPHRRNKIILREALFAFLILTAFLFAGQHILHSLNISESSISIAGGIILFLIAIEMIFPKEMHNSQKDKHMGEPFIVPLAIPMIAGPSALATVLIFASQTQHYPTIYFMALAIASIITTIILLFAGHLRKILGQKGLIAMERLMGLILTTVAVQMFLDGIKTYFHLAS